MRTFFGNGSNAETGNVVSMDRFRSGRSLAPVRQAEAYWSALRGGRTVPQRSDIDPRGLEGVLEYTFILERIAPGVARFRLAGHHLTSVAGMEVRGMPLTALFLPSARDELGATIEHVLDTPAIAELSLVSERRFGRAQLEGRMILLPLLDDRGQTSRILGVLIVDGTIGAAPHRFEIAGSTLRQLGGVIADLEQEDPVTPVHEPGFAEAQAPLKRRPPYLRLVKSDE